MEDSSQVVVIAEKVCNKFYLFGHINRGGGLVNLSDGKSIKFIALNDKFVMIQLLESGIGKPIQNQSWSKVVVEKKPKEKSSQVQLATAVEVEDLI